MDQNLSLYKIFYTVAKTGNISKAAKELYISQPAISKSINKLEQNLNIALFNRNSRGVTLTEEGRILFEKVQLAFDAILAGEEHIRQVNALGVGHITIGVSTTLCKYVLLPYLKKFIELYPHIKITIKCQSTNQTLSLLEQHKIDVGLIGKSKAIKNIDFYPIKEIEDIFVTTNTYINNLKLREKNNTSDIFSTATLMLLDKENMTRQYIDSYFENNNIHVNNLIEVSDMDLLIEFAKISLGVACVIKDFVKEDLEFKRLIQIPLEVPINKREIGFAFNENITPSKPIETFIEYYKMNPDL